MARSVTARQMLQRHVATRARLRGAPLKCGFCREPLRWEDGKGYVHLDGEGVIVFDLEGKAERDGHLATPRRS